MSRARGVGARLSGPVGWLLVLIVVGMGVNLSALDLLVQAYLFAILALAVDIQWGYTGILTFGSAAFFGIGAYSVGIVFVHVTTASWALPLAILIAIVASAAVALALGWLAFYSRIQLSVFYIAIVTLAVSVLFEQAVTDGGEFTGASNGLSDFTTVSLGVFSWYWIAALVLFGAMFLGWRLVHSDAGLVLRGVRDHEQRLRYLGFDVSAVKTAVFVVCAAVAAVAGALYAGYTTVVAPSLVDFYLATNVLIWTALGGRGTIVWPVLAATVINYVSPSLNSQFPYYWQLILGAAFVLVVMFASDGLGPRLVWLVSSARGRLRPDAKVAPRQAADAEILRRAQPAGGRGAGREVLSVSGVSKRFGAFTALEDVTFDASAGELIGIVGPNGAGKSTLMRCIADGGERSAGTVTVSGQSIDESQPNVVARLGVARKFQTPNVFDTLTVGDAIKLASWSGRVGSPWRRSSSVAISESCTTVVGLTDLERVWDTPARHLNHGEKQALELAMVLACDPSVLLLDEPTAGLTSGQRQMIGSVLHKLAERGMCILLVEHDFAFVKQVTSRMLVLHQGRLLADGKVEQVAATDAVQRVYLGAQV